MEKLKVFFYDFFLAIGIVWFFNALSIMFFNFTYTTKEILLILITGLAFAIFRVLTKKGSSQTIKKDETQGTNNAQIEK